MTKHKSLKYNENTKQNMLFDTLENEKLRPRFLRRFIFKKKEFPNLRNLFLRMIIQNILTSTHAEIFSETEPNVNGHLNLQISHEILLRIYNSLLYCSNQLCKKEKKKVLEGVSQLEKITMTDYNFPFEHLMAKVDI